MEHFIILSFVLLCALFGLVVYTYCLIRDMYTKVIDLSVDLHTMYSNFKDFEAFNKSMCFSDMSALQETNSAVQHMASGYDELTQNVIKLMFGNPADQKGCDNEQ